MQLTTDQRLTCKTSAVMQLAKPCAPGKPFLTVSAITCLSTKALTIATALKFMPPSIDLSMRAQS